MAKPFKTAAKSNTKQPLSTGKKRLLLAGVSLVIILAAGGLTGWWLVAHNGPSVPKLMPKDTPADAQQQASDLLEKSSQSSDASKSSLDQTRSQLSDLEKSAKTTDLKQVYGGAIVDLYQQAGDLQGARDAGIDDENQYGTAYTAAHLAGVYEQLGDYGNAAKYYKLAADRSPKTGPKENSAYNDYRAKQQQMEQRQ